MNIGSVFVDTWGWLALGHRRDPHHSEVRSLYQSLRDQNVSILTSDYVLDEVITLLFRRELYAEAVGYMDGILAAANAHQVRVERVSPERFSAAWQLRRRFQDKPRISFTDLTSMVIMQECHVIHVLTEDDHFLQTGMGFFKVP